MSRIAPSAVKPGGPCPDDALFLHIENAASQAVEYQRQDDRPIYAMDEKSRQWVRVELRRLA